MRYQKPALIIDARDLPRVTVNFAPPSSEGCGKDLKPSMPRVVETSVADDIIRINERDKEND